jgi:predicted ATP-grasp superfamily ATP-dependent carboligase
MMPAPVIEPVDMYFDLDPIGTEIAYEVIPDVSKWPASVISVKRIGYIETDYGPAIVPYQFGVIREQIMPVRIYLREGGFVMYASIKSMLQNGWVMDHEELL